MKERHKSIEDLTRMVSPSQIRRGPMLFEDWEKQRGVSIDPTAAKAPAVVYTLRVKCAWGAYLREPCTRVIEMKDNSTLTDLHYVIQQAVRFDCDHLFAFYVGRTFRQRKLIFTESDDWEAQLDAYEEIALKRIWPLPDNMKLIYWFDFGDDWKFEVTKARKVKAPERGVRYPVLVKSLGPDPEQYPDLEDA